MRYDHVTKARFLTRLNRFEAMCEIDGEFELVHVCNTGRCRELLVPGALVYLSLSGNAKRKTRYDLIAVEKIGRDGKTRLINMDSSAPNRAAREWLEARLSNLRSEVCCHDSRFDFLALEDGIPLWIEVKGVTLEEEGVAKFPDAPTQRGLKHLNELIERKKMGEGAMVLLVIQMEHALRFEPNAATDPAFARALAEAKECGVEIRALLCRVTAETMTICGETEVCLWVR